MPAVWIVTSTVEPLIEIFEAAGWDIVQSEHVPDSHPRYPDVAIYSIDDATKHSAFVTFCQLKIMPVLALTPDWNLAEQAIEVGADDVVVAPINPAEVMLRAHKLAHDPNAVRAGKLMVDPAARRVKYNGRPIHLSPVEFRVLACLVEHLGQAVSFDQILDEVWGYDLTSGGAPEQVKTVIKRLRQKIEPDPRHPQYIISIRTVGYRLRNQMQWDDNS